MRYIFFSIFSFFLFSNLWVYPQETAPMQQLARCGICLDARGDKTVPWTSDQGLFVHASCYEIIKECEHAQNKTNTSSFGLPRDRKHAALIRKLQHHLGRSSIKEYYLVHGKEKLQDLFTQCSGINPSRL